jgi:tetratricopeptide (TPR) repeat protein
MTCGNQALSFIKPRLIRNSLPWVWVGALHEYLFCANAQNIQELDGIWYRIGSDGKRSEDPEKFLKAARLLEEEFKSNDTDPRTVFYLAESYRDAGRQGEALQWYLKRASMNGWDEEVFWSLLQAGHLLQALQVPRSAAIHYYTQAHQLVPWRCEAIYFLAECYNKENDFLKAHELFKKMGTLRQGKLFNLEWIANYGIALQRSVTAYYVGNYRESFDICEQLLTNQSLPEHLKELVVSNRQYAVAKIPQYEKRP